MNASAVCSPKSVTNPYNSKNNNNFKTGTMNTGISDDDSMNGSDRFKSPQPFHLKSVQDRYI